MAMFQDDSTDDETCHLQLGERLRINRGDLGTKSKTMNGKEKKQLFNQHRKNHIFEEQTSSSSSLDMQNDSFLPGPVSSRSLQNKKRQNGDKPIDQFTNPKRTCLDEACQRSPGFSGCRRKVTNGDIPHSRKIMDFSAEAPNSSSLSLFPDKTYEDHLSQAKRTKACNSIQGDAEDSDIEIWPRQNKKSPAKNAGPHEMPFARSQGVQLIDSASEDDSRLMPSGALKGGRQSPDLAISKKVVGRKVKRVLDSDDSESEDWPVGYRARPLIFSSSDSEDSKPFARLKTKSSDVVSKKSANLSFSSGDSQKSGLDHHYHTAGGSSSLFDNHFVNPPTPPRTNYRTRSPSYKTYKTRSSNRANGQPAPMFNTIGHSIRENLRNPERPMQPTLSLPTQRRTLRSSRRGDARLGTDSTQQPNSGIDSRNAGSSGGTANSCQFPSTSAFYLPGFGNGPEVPPVTPPKLTRGTSSRKPPDTSSSRRLFGRARPLRPKPNLATAHPDIFGEEDSSEVEFFTANSYSDNESNTEPYSTVLLDSLTGQPDPNSPVPAAPSVNVVSSEDEISVVFTKGPRTDPTPWSYQSRRGASRTLGRRYNRGSRRNLSRSQDVSLSPDPVEQVRQVEEDERFARMLQAQFDAEVDPTFVPRPHLSPNPCQMNTVEYSSSDDSSVPDMREDDLAYSSPTARRLPYPRRRSQFMAVFGPDILPRRNFNVRINVNSSRPQFSERWMGNQQPIWHPLLARHVLRNPLNLYPALEDDSYEAFLGLADMNGDVARGLQKSQINRLPTRKYIPMNGASTSNAAELPHKRAELNKECQVCLNDYASGDLLRILPCFHEFHTPCIDPWLKINHTCPVCRVVVDLDE